MPRSATSKQRLVIELQDKEFRDEYVSAHISAGLAHQIRILREQRGWTQAQLAGKIGTKQNVVSRWEDPNYGKLTIETLSKLASAFDVALLVRFVPFSRFVQETADLTSSALEAVAFTEDTFLERGLSGTAAEAWLFLQEATNPVPSLLLRKVKHTKLVPGMMTSTTIPGRTAQTPENAEEVTYG